MLSINLLPQDEYRWTGENPSQEIFPSEKNIYPLYHQWCTYNAEESIIVNTYNTGTGKTKAALLRLLKRARDKGFANLYSARDNVLLIAPTNELLLQHVDDARDFCEKNKLPYRVLPLTKEHLEMYKEQPGFSEKKLRRSAAEHYILNDGSRVDNDTDKRATIYVINPDIFYYAVFFCYNCFDRGPLSSDFFSLFNYIIIDEFHYYNPKQLVAFLFFMKFSCHNGYVGSRSKQRQFCILTATPRPQVTYYLNNLGMTIRWITPGNVVSEETSPVCALTSVQLFVYSREELQEPEGASGLLQLVLRERKTIGNLLQEAPDGTDSTDGAIISSSLGTINRIHNELLLFIPPHVLGRITGPEDRNSRNEAKEKQLILATPTVDIGYNFERSQPKKRQNIDFLFIDAYSSDEFIQRIGRAGRVLAKEHKTQASSVYAVVDSTSYDLLKAYDAGDLERSHLSEISQKMPTKNDLYAYIRTGAIAEIIRPIAFMKRGMTDEQQEKVDLFLQELQELFLGQVSAKVKYKDLEKLVFQYDDCQKHYSGLHNIPQEAFDVWPLVLEQRNSTPFEHPETNTCLEAFAERLKDVHGRNIPLGKSGKAILQWQKKDLCTYFKEKARFSFREGFQPPLALVSDPQCLHSSKLVTTYNALHFIQHYRATFYETQESWANDRTRSVAGIDMTNVSIYCELNELLDVPLRIGLMLKVTEYLQDAWEEQFAYQVTALYGLEIVALNNQGGLKMAVQSLLRSQFVPLFVILDSKDSYASAEMHALRKKARIYPLPLEVTFCDGSRQKYTAILGTMAFQVCAEIPYWAKLKDRRKTQLADDEPIIC